MFKINKQKEKEQAFLRNYPDAAKIYIRPHRSAILDIPRVDNAPSERFEENKVKGIYLAPDTTAVLNLLCEVPVKWVDTYDVYTDAVEFTPARRGKYTLTFDEKTNRFLLASVGD